MCGVVFAGGARVRGSALMAPLMCRGQALLRRVLPELGPGESGCCCRSSRALAPAAMGLGFGIVQESDDVNVADGHQPFADHAGKGVK